MSPDSERPDLRRIGESAFLESLGTLLSLTATVRASADRNPIPAAPEDINSNVLLAGRQISGGVHLRLPQAFVASAVRRLASLEGDAGNSKELQDDAAGELANIVAGRVAAQLAAKGYSCTLGTPSVSRGSRLPIETEPGVDLGRTELICDGHFLSLELHCRYPVP